MTAVPPPPYVIDEATLRRVANDQASQLEAEAAAVVAAGGMGSLGLLSADMTDGLRDLSRRKLAAAKYDLALIQLAGGDTTWAELGVRMESAVYQMAGGTPDEVPADHVTAFVRSNDPSIVIGFTPVPASIARFDAATGRFEADAQDL